MKKSMYLGLFLLLFMGGLTQTTPVEKAKNKKAAYAKALGKIGIALGIIGSNIGFHSYNDDDENDGKDKGWVNPFPPYIKEVKGIYTQFDQPHQKFHATLLASCYTAAGILFYQGISELDELINVSSTIKNAYNKLANKWRKSPKWRS